MTSSELPRAVPDGPLRHPRLLITGTEPSRPHLSAAMHPVPPRSQSTTENMPLWQTNPQHSACQRLTSSPSFLCTAIATQRSRACSARRRPRGPTGDSGPYAGHAGAARRCLKEHSRQRGPTGTTGRARAAGATRRRMHISAPPAAGPARGPRAARGPEELHDSEWSHGCQCGHDLVTGCFHPYPQVTVDDSQRSILD